MSYGPTGGLPTAGSPVPAGSGAWLSSGTSSAIFYNGASYATGQLFVAGGSGASFVGAGMVAHTFQDGFFEWLRVDDQLPLPSGRMVFKYGILDNPFVDGISVGVATQVVQSIHMAQGLSFTAATSYVWTPGAEIVEALQVVNQAVGTIYMRVAMTQNLQIAHAQVVALLAAVTETIGLTPVLEAYIGTIALQRLLMRDTVQASMVYALTVTEALKIAETYHRFIGAFVTDEVTLGDTVSQRYKAIAQITEMMTLALDQRYIMAFRVSARDGVVIDDDAILNMVYRESMTEEIDLEILYQAPNGAVTSFAINTRTGAVTEYQGWSFNSFVQVGNQYIAANKDGLFELNGPTDAGLSVVADIVGSFLQPGGPHLSGLKGVYLGQSGTGYWLLKIDTGDGREYIYQRLSNPGLMTTKFTIGKGINARYIGWELINVEGQDFDLDVIEFVPMLRTRRI